MELVFRRHLSLLIISVVSACLENEKTVGYENAAVDLEFSITVAGSGLKNYFITRINSTSDITLLAVIYDDGNFIDMGVNGGLELIGNVPAGNLSIRIPSMNISFSGNYILKSFPPLEDIKCIELVFRARPKPPVIPSSDPSGNSITGIEDKDVTLVCRSTGGYPKPDMAWYRTSNQTSPLVTNTDQPQRDDRTYRLDYIFRAKRADDGATFVCQSSYDPPDPLYMQAEIKLNLSLKPSTPILSLHTPLRESANQMVIANCSSAGFKPDTARLTLMDEGRTVVLATNSYPSSNGMFIVTAEYSSTITKTINSKLLTCIVNHTALDAPLIAQRNLDVQFAPETATLSGETSGILADVKNKITLTCTAGSSNPPSDIMWYKNNSKMESNSQIQLSPGKYNGHVTSQDLVLEAVRAMDGVEIFCEVHNVVNGDNHLKSQTTTIDLNCPPQIPEEVSIEKTQSNAVILSWVPGFHGGFNQTFVIEYSTDGQNWLSGNTVEIQAGLTLTRINGTVSNLQSGTLYYMRLMSHNKKGNSNYTKVFNVTTDLSPDRDALTENNLLPAVVGGIAAVIAIGVAVIVVLLIKRRSRKHAGEQTDGGHDVYYNIDRPVYDDLRYDGNPHTYSVLGHVGNYEDLTHDTTGMQPYSNLSKVDGSHPASLVDKTYENLQLSPSEEAICPDFI